MAKIDDELDRIFFPDPINETRRRRIDSAIQRLEVEREKTYDRAYPVGGTGVCRDGNALGAVIALDKKIAELRAAKSAVISGAPTAEETLAKPARSTALPLPTPLETKAVKNPLNEIDTLPTGDGLKAIVEQLSGYALHHVNRMMNKFRSAGGKQNAAVAYTQGEHDAVRMTLAAMVVDYRRLFKTARERRETQIQQVELNARANRALIENLLKRVDAIEARPRQEYKGIWAAGIDYHEANTVTHNGSVWYAWRPTRQQPGSGADWQLQVKKGKDSNVR